MNEETLFIEAVEIPDPAERAAYLDRACAGDAALRARLDRLLDEHRRAGSFLGRPAVAPGATATFDPVPEAETAALAGEFVGTQIGPYKLLQQIGEGGMGAVYMAEQTQPVKRKVALKVIKAGMDSRQVVARFEAERQALALMDHANIARVFDGGTTETGRPYFVMELVHGVPITKYCDDNRLSPRQRLELFIPVCQAIQHAHQKGIIHRDIKPSNVMVTLYDGKPVAKVIDFGVAKATEQRLTERTLFTQYGTMVGTLEYMSPEQAEMSALGVDTRSDIYSLGVLLYELLTGSTPLSHKRMKEAAYAEILRMIKEEEPPKPSTRLSDSGEALASISANRHTEPAALTKLFRGEVDWIVMKALEKDRNRRYETANGFAADVQRHLNDETVQACPPSASYRFRKFARRNKRALITASVIGLALLLAVASLGWVVRDREAGRVRTGVEVGQFLRRAEAHYADNKLPEAAAEVQKARGVLEAGKGDEDLDRRVRQWLTDLDTAVRLEEIRLESYDLENRDRGYADYARVFRDYGIDVEALPAEEVAARVAASQIKFDLVLALGNWASRLQFDPRPQGPARWQRLLAIYRAAAPDSWHLRLVGAVEAKDVRTLRELADGADPGRMRTRTLAYLGNSLRTAGDAEAAVAFLRRAQRQHPGDFSINSNLALCLSELKPPPWDEVIAFRRVALAARPRSAWAHDALGVALWHKGRIDEAIVEYREAIRLRPGYVHAHNGLGNALRDQKRLDEAITCYRRAIELDPKYAIAHYNLGNVLRDQMKLDEAIASYKQAIALDPKDADARNGLGNALADQKKLDEAVAAYRKAIKLDPKYANAHYGLGKALRAQKKLDEAIACYKQAIELDPKDADAHNGLGNALNDQGKRDEAIACYKQAIKLDPKDGLNHRNLGKALRARGDVDEAIACYRKAIELDPNDADAHYILGNALCDQKKLDEAFTCYTKAIELDPKFAFAHVALGDIWKERGKLDEAIACYRRAIGIDPKFAAAHFKLGNALYDQKKMDEAIASYKQAIELDPKDAIAHNNLGNALKARGKPEEAIASYRKAIEIEPKNAMFRRNLARALSDQRKLDEAIAEYREAIRLEPDHAKAHNDLGIALRARNKTDEAIAAFREAIRLKPEYAPGHNDLGALLCDGKRDYDGAIKAFREAIRLKPDFVDAHCNLGHALAGKGRLDDAIAAYRAAIRLKPDHIGSHIGLAFALADTGRNDDAVAALREAIRLKPGEPNAHNGLGWVLAKMGRVEEAIASYREAIRLKPDDTRPHNNLAWLLATGPDPKFWDGKRAVELITRSGELGGKTGLYWRYLGAAHYRAGDWKESLAALQKSVEVCKGGDAIDWFFLAMAHWQSGNKAEARTWYDKAVVWTEKHRPKDDELRRFRAESEKLMGIGAAWRSPRTRSRSCDRRTPAPVTGRRDDSGRWGPYRQASPPPARHRPAHGLRAQRAVVILSQTTPAKETTMWFRTLFESLKRPARAAARPSRRPTPCRLSVEALDDRIVPAAMLVIGDATLLEGNEGTHNAVVTVSVTEPHSNALSVNYRTADGTATAGGDYNTVSGTLTFAKGEMSKTILVPVIGDRVPEPNESFFVQLSNAKGAQIADGQAVVTIVDDEPRISINNASLLEGNSGSAPMSFTVSLSAAYDLPVHVNYATADSRARVIAASGTLVFEPGQTTQTITVQVIGNRSAELGWYKTFLVNLSTPDSYAAISDTGVGVGYIVEDEPQIAIVADAYHGETTYTFTVSLSAAYDQPVTVDFTTADGTAIAGVDYLAAAGTLTFAPGETSKTITVDVLSSGDKYFIVYLSNASTNAVIGNEGALGDLYIYDGYSSGSTGYDPYPYGM